MKNFRNVQIALQFASDIGSQANVENFSAIVNVLFVTQKASDIGEADADYQIYNTKTK